MLEEFEAVVSPGQVDVLFLVFRCRCFDDRMTSLTPVIPKSPLSGSVEYARSISWSNVVIDD